MLDALLQSEPQVRLAAFSLTLLAILGWELLATRRAGQGRRLQRTLTHILLLVVNTLALRLLMPMLAFELALELQARQLGLMGLVPASNGVKFFLSLALLDLAIYAQHVAFHKIPFLWRFHRVHHADTLFDVTTGVRFHPGEILLSMTYKLGLVLVLGPSAAAVLVFEILLSSSSLFTHANARMPAKLDCFLRRLIVTPDMHRIHHSVQADEALKNFGFNLSLWDRVFRTYQSNPALPHATMPIGTSGVSPARAGSFMAMMALPGDPPLG